MTELARILPTRRAGIASQVSSGLWSHRVWVVLVAVCVALVGAWVLRGTLSGYDAATVDAERILLPIGSPGSPLGTDAYGRDLVARLLAGAPISLLAGAIPATGGMIIGMAIGLAAGILGDRSDRLLMSAMDLFMSFPFILMALMLVAILGRSVETMVVAVTLALVPKNARFVRAEALTVRERDYVTAARLAGAGRLSITVRHLLPNILPTILIVGSTDIGLMIGNTAGLSFLGLGVQQPSVDWGTLVSDGAKYITSAPALALIPSVLVALLSVLFVLAGDDLRHRWSRVG